MTSAVLTSGRAKPVGFGARVTGLVGTLGFAVRLTGGGTFALCASVFTSTGFGLDEKSMFGGSELCRKADIRFSSAGVGFLLNVRACPLVGESLAGVGVNGGIGPPKRMPMEASLLGERGESTVTIGGDFWDGITDTIDSGLGLGGLSRLFLRTGGPWPLGMTLLAIGAGEGDRDVLPSDVPGRPFGIGASTVSET